MFLLVKTDDFALGTLCWCYKIIFWCFMLESVPVGPKKKFGGHISTRWWDMANLRFWDIYIKYSGYVYTQHVYMSKIKGPHISTPRWVSTTKKIWGPIGAVSNTKHQKKKFSDPQGVPTAKSSLFLLVDHFSPKLDFRALLAGKIVFFKILAQQVDFRSWKFQEIWFLGRGVRIRGDLELSWVLIEIYF